MRVRSHNFILLGIISLSFISINSKGLVNTQSKFEKDTLLEYEQGAHLATAIIKRDTVNVDSLIRDAKKTVDKYRQSELEKRALVKEELKLMKTEISLHKQQNDVTKEIIAKLRKRIIDQDSTKEAVLLVDSTCIDRGSVFGKIFNRKCIKYAYNYSIQIGDKVYPLDSNGWHK